MGVDVVRCGFYLAAASIYAYSLWFDVVVVKIGDSSVLTYRGYGGKFKYLTFWNHCLQTAYFTLCAVCAVIGCRGDKPDGPSRWRSSLHRLRDVLHCSLTFPVGTFVVMTFWGLYAVDRELVFPRVLDAFIPSWLNHVMHTTVLPILLVEKYLVHHRHPARHKGMLLVSFFGFSYMSWMLWIAYAAGIWVYPVLRVMGITQRVFFLSSLVVLGNAVYLVGEGVTAFLWRKEKMATAALLESVEKNK